MFTFSTFKSDDTFVSNFIVLFLNERNVTVLIKWTPTRIYIYMYKKVVFVYNFNSGVNFL